MSRPRLRRRTFLALAAGAGGALWLARPSDEGGPYNDYFRALNDELKAHGPMRPCMVVDLDRVDANLAVVRRSIRAPKHFRVVAKSLPSVPLLRYVLQAAGTQRLMAFHQPFLNVQAEAFPTSDILLGKPMPARTAELFYEQLKGTFDPDRQLQWLVDTPERLQQYLALARKLGRRMRFNIEIDVGLHRGGVRDLETLGAMLTLMTSNPAQSEFSGFMGYDPHVMGVPRILGSVAGRLHDVKETYRGFVEAVRTRAPTLWRDDLTLNGAGSPTYRLYEDDALLNDLSVGSALVKPCDFDVSTLTDHVPAVFIATPVLKVLNEARLPGLEGASRVLSLWDPNRERTFFMYGGKWLARFESPPGLRSQELYGHSSNQEYFNGSNRVPLAVDDHVFLRPTQSESVMLQFGNLVVVRGGRVVDSWPVFPTG